jgi:hypothetical protein
VDPESSQADELRRLLNVVSGRAPDLLGRTSEPLVKEELAIVEFLTAKTIPNPRLTLAARSDPDQTQTPVDLLLGLATTRSGRRAAEEEKRQLKLQQLRETQEARQSAVNGNGNGMTSPWGYVAPSMPGLDVHQPFGDGRKAPRPLQPPKPKRTLAEWSEDIFSHGLEEQASGFNTGNGELLPSPRRDTFSDEQNQYSLQTPIQKQHNQPYHQAFTNNQPNLNTHELDHNNAINRSLHSISPQIQLSPFSDLSTNPLQTQQAYSNLTQQFGNNDFVDGFDFDMTGLNGNSNEGESVLGAGSGFNPFALAQNQLVEEG